MDITFPTFNYNAILCRYGELALKGGNRSAFEKKLVENINRALTDVCDSKCLRTNGRLVVLPRQAESFNRRELVEILRRLSRVFGLVSVSPAFAIPSDKEKIESLIMEKFPILYDTVCRQVETGLPVTYAIRARRRVSSFPVSSTQLEKEFADKLLSRFERLKVDLTDPILRIDMEIRNEATYIMWEYIECPGGLPMGTAARVLTLLSGGIDSPAACYKIMRRGSGSDFITFHSYPYTPPATTRKVTRIAEQLNVYQQQGLLFIVNLLEAQKQIRDRAYPRYRTILYRRLMVRIAEEITQKTGAQALVSGDNLGQVASQTLENLTVISDAVRLPVFRPLLCNEKNETTALARTIGTFKISSQQTPDSCTVFAPTQPATRTSVEKIEREEAKLDIQQLISVSLERTTVCNPGNSPNSA